MQWKTNDYLKIRLHSWRLTDSTPSSRPQPDGVPELGTRGPHEAPHQIDAVVLFRRRGDGLIVVVIVVDVVVDVIR